MATPIFVRSRELTYATYMFQFNITFETSLACALYLHSGNNWFQAIFQNNLKYHKCTYKGMGS